MSASVVAGGDCAESLLSSGIPLKTFKKKLFLIKAVAFGYIWLFCAW